MDKTLSVSSIDGVIGDNIDNPSLSLSNTLYGKIPGATVRQTNGTPGSDAPLLNVRGIGTYYASDIPVFVDGFQINRIYLEALSAFEIEKVEVLKDAAALAAFGMRGANGVLWITTKRGKIQKTEVSLQSRLGFQQATGIQKPLRTSDFTRLYNEAYSNDLGAWTNFYTAHDVNILPDIDWYDQVLRNMAPLYNTNIAVRGGDNVAKYYVMLGYSGQRGLYNVPINDTVANAGYNKYNFRSNLDVNLFDFLEAKIDLGGFIAISTRPNTDVESLWNDLARYPSLIYPVMNSVNGEWSGTTVYPNNPVAETRASGRFSTHQRSLQFNLTLKEKLDAILPGLYLKQRLSTSSWVKDAASNTRTYARYINDVQQTTDINTPYIRYENYGDGQWSWKHFGATLGYDRAQGKHLIGASINGLYNIYKTDLYQNALAGLMMNYKYANVNGAFNYSFDKKYIAEIVLTASGSDNYKPGNRWGGYPTAGLGWIISNEEFLKKNKHINSLKLRASAGQTGYDPMGKERFLWQTYYSNQGGVNTGNGNPTWNTGMGMMYLANPSIFAERSTKFDVGIDAKLFGQLQVELNGFWDNRTGIVTPNNNIPATFGVKPPFGNVGKVTNRGFESKLSYTGDVEDFRYSTTAILSYARNTINYMAEVITVPTAARTGNSIGSVFGYETDGFYDISDFDAAGNLKEGVVISTFGNVKPGDVKYKDLLADGFIDENDQRLIGNSLLPEYTYSFQLGFEWRGIDFQAFLQGVVGRDVNLLTDAPIQTIAFRNNGNVYPIAEGRWVYYPEKNLDTRHSATYPRLSLEESNNNYRKSTLWMRNGDFVKLRNIELGYTLPKTMSQPIGIEKCRFFITAINMLEISEIRKEFKTDAEVLSGYPAMKSYNFGFTLNF